MRNATQDGRAVNALMRSLLGLALLLLASYVNDARLGGAEAANRYSIGAGSLNWSANGSWSAATCGAALVATTAPTANDSVWICAGTSVVVNATAVAAQVLIAAGGVLRGGARPLTIGSSNTNVGATLLTVNGGFTPQTGTVRFARAASATLFSGTVTGIDFNNLEIVPQLHGGNITQTLAGGSIASVTVGGNMTINPPDGSAGNARTLTINDGTLTAATVVGTLSLSSSNTDPVTFNTGGIPWTLGQLIIGGGGTGLKRFSAGASTIELNGTTSPLITRATSGRFTAATSTVLVTSPGSVTLNSGAFQTIHAFNNLTIDAAGQVIDLSGTANEDVRVNTELRIIGGTLDTNSRLLVGDNTGTFSVGPASTFTMSGTSPFPTGFTAANYSFAPTSTTRYLQTSNQTVSARDYGNLEISGASAGVQHTFTGASTTSAVNLTVGGGALATLVSAATAGTILNISGNVSISPLATMTANAASAFTVGGNWAKDGHFVANGGTVTLNGANAQTIAGSSVTTFNNLTVANTHADGVTMAQSVVVGATLTLSNANPFLVGPSLLTLNGPSIATTPTALSTTSASSLTFGGSSAGVTMPDKFLAMDRLTLNNTNGLAATGASTSVVVGGVLTLQSGVLDMGTANTLTTTSACAVSVTTGGPSPDRWVRGSMRAAIPAAATCQFPLGDSAANYTPLTLIFSSVTTPGSVTASVLGQAHRNTTAGTSGIDVTKGVNRYWTLKNSTVAGSYSAVFVYVGGDNAGGTPASYRFRRGTNCTGSLTSRTCVPWGSIAVSGTPTTTTATTASGLTIAADNSLHYDFAIGEPDTSTNFLREKQFIYTRELY